MDTGISLVIPFTVIGVFAAVQVLLGASPAIVAMCAAAFAVSFLPLRLYGRDLYGVLAVGFGLKYPGMALAAKTLYGQTLESNLYDPYASFGLILLLMFGLTAMLIVARALDRGGAFFPFPLDLVSLRRLSVICIGIGIVGNIAVTASRFTGEPNGGAMVVIGQAFREYYYLGLITEAVYAIGKTDGRKFVTKRLFLLFLVQTIFAISSNEREVVVTCIIGLITVAFLYNILRIRHAIFIFLAGGFFISVFTPITLYLRMHREGMSAFEFMELAESTIIKAIADPDFFKLISDTEKFATYQNMAAVVPYDYFGNRSDVLDRLTYVSLVDAVYNGTLTRVPLGMEAVEQAFARAAPSFLGYDKRIINDTGLGDWLSWQTGLEEPGIISFTVFGLPMEGLAAWGLPGMIVYPFIFMLPILYICGRLSSLRLPLPLSVYLFVDTQHMMFESTSEVYLAWVTRTLPVNILILFALYHLLRARVSLTRAGAV